MRQAENYQLAEAIALGADPLFDPFTGANIGGGEVAVAFRAAEMGLEAPRFCQICGRRMVVQIDPDGWTAQCSRHGELTAALFEQR